MKEVSAAFLVLCFLLLLIAGGMWGCPTYRVWQQEKEGEAALMRATQERKIQVEQAQAELEASQLRADAIKIVGEAAQSFPEYRYQEFLGAFAEALKEGAVHQVIYVPTEANIPIMEAGKR